MTRLRTVGAICLMMSTLVVAASCGRANDFSPDGHLAQIDAAYRQGQRARTSMTHNGVAVTDKTCAGEFTATGAVDDSYDPKNKAFQAQRKVAYINGCMNRPNTHSSSLPSPSSSS